MPHTPILFKKIPKRADYLKTLARMEAHVNQMLTESALEEVWLLEHPSLYTLGVSASDEDILTLAPLPVYRTSRGGRATYHGPGQRVAYVMLDLSRRGQDLHQYVWKLEEWLILTLQELGITGERRKGRIGVWVCTAEGKEKKIAAIGVKIRKWITFHGISLNVNPDLRYYEAIIPCGLSDYEMTSLHALGVRASMVEVDQILEKTFHLLFANVSSPANSSQQKPLACRLISRS